MTVTDQAVASATNFITGILVGRFCSKSEFGVYILGYSILIFLVTIQNALIGSPLCINHSRLCPSQLPLYTGSTFVHQVGFSIISVLLFTVFNWTLDLLQVPHALIADVFPLVLTTPLILGREYLRKLSFSSFRPELALALDLGAAVIQLPGLLVMARFARLNSSLTFDCIALSCGVSSSLWLLLNRAEISIVKTRIACDFKRSWQTGKWIFSSSILWAASAYVCPWLVATMQGIESAGIWAACFGVSAVANPLLLGLQNFVEPKVVFSYARNGGTGFRNTVYASAFLLGVVMFSFVIALMFSSNFLLTRMYNGRYQNHAVTITTLSTAYALGAIGFPFSCGLFAGDRASADAKVNLSYPVVMLIVGIPAIQYFGVTGGAISLAVAHFLALILRITIFNITEVYPRKTVLSKHP